SPPASQAEQRIAEIWRAVLGTAQVGILDNFFDLGGDSLRLMRVRNELQRAFSRELAIVDLFRYTTVAALAQHLTSGDGVAGAQVTQQDLVQARRDAARHRLQIRQKARVN